MEHAEGPLAGPAGWRHFGRRYDYICYVLELHRHSEEVELAEDFLEQKVALNAMNSLGLGIVACAAIGYY